MVESWSAIRRFSEDRVADNIGVPSAVHREYITSAIVLFID